MTPAVSDVELVARCAAGDDRALAGLYDAFGRSAYGLALRVVRDPAYAEDVVQEAFLDAWRNARSYDPARAKVSSWLFTFVHRRAIDLIRREESRRQRPVSPDELPEAADAVGDVADDVAASDTSTRLRRALASLSAQHREVIELAYFGGYSQSEIAERIGEPLGTVKSRTFAALSHLRSVVPEGDR